MPERSGEITDEMVERAAQALAGDPPRWLGAPLIVHQCPNCKRLFDSPSVCMDDGSQTAQIVRMIKVVLWQKCDGPQGNGIAKRDWDADAVIEVDFENGVATVFPIVQGSINKGAYSSTGPDRTDGLNIVAIAERTSF